jgi:O-methyltransferase
VEPASFGSALLWQFWRGRGGYLVTDGGVDALVAVVEKYGLGAVVLTKSQYRSLNEVTGFERDVTAVKEVDITSLTRVSKVDNERISALFPQASPAAAPAMDGRLRLLAARTGAATPQTPVSANTPAPSERVAELSDLMGEVGASYVELLVGVLTRWAFDHEYVPAVGGEQYRKVAIDRQARAIGRDWPADAETMVGVHRLRHLAACVAQLVRDGVPGDLLEAGVWRGGSCMVMRAALRAMGEESKTIWAADSYAGFPEQDFTLAAAVDAEDTCAYRFPLISVGLPVVQRNFERYGLLDDRVRFVPGWFHETLPGLDVGELALLRVDGDLYDSTWAPLDAMYPKLAVGGYCIVDDYGDVSACRDAVDEYRRVHGITEPIQWIDTDAVYWRKTR